MARAPSPGRGGQLGLPELPRGQLPGSLPVMRGADGLAATTAAGAMQAGLAERIGNLVARRHERHDREAVDNAREAGFAAGNEAPGTMMEGGGALYRDAFNAAAVEGGSRRLEVQVRERLDALAGEHEANPAGFTAAAQAYRQGIASTLPEALRTRFELGFDTLARPFANRITEAQRQQVAQQAIAAYDEVLPRRIAAIDRLGRESLRDPAALAALRLEEDNALADLARLGPRTAFTFAGREFAADPTRAGALTLPQLVAQQRRLTEAGIVATALGAFAAGPRTDAWIAEWLQRERSPQGSGLTPELIARIERDMRGELADMTAGRREAQGLAWAGLQPRLAAVRASVQLTGRASDTISDEELTAAGRSPAEIAAFRRDMAFAQLSFAANRDLATAGPEELARLQQRIFPGGDLFQLNPAGALQMAQRLANRQEGAARAALEQRIADATAQLAAGPVLPSVPARGDAPRIIAAGIAARAALDPNAPDYAEQVQRINNQVMAGVMPGAPAQPVTPEMPRVTRDEAQAAGLTAEQQAAINRQAEALEARAQAARTGATGTPEQIAAARAARPIAGDQAAENADALRALEEALQRRLAAREQPGDYVLQHFPEVAPAWQAALADPALAGQAIAVTLDAQQRLGDVPSNQRQPMPRRVAQQMVQALAELRTDPERLQMLGRQLAAIPQASTRAQVLASLREAGLGEPLAIAAAVRERGGELVAARIATELAQDVSRLGQDPAARRVLREATAGVFDADSRLGSLRREQYRATGSAEFLRLGEQEQGLLERIIAVRAPTGGFFSSQSSEIRTAYGQLFGGRQVVNQGSQGVLVSVPAGTDAGRVVEGLGVLADQRLAQLLPGQERAAARGMLRRDSVWVDYGAGQYALYGRGRAMPLPGPDGRAIIVTLEDALAARAPAPAPGAARGAAAEPIESFWSRGNPP
jgi:hypothetical protein